MANPGREVLEEEVAGEEVDVVAEEVDVVAETTTCTEEYIDLSYN
jgi:hypothetical protein